MFSKARNMVLHMIRSHPGEKPYACDKCEFCTANKNSLNRHISQVHQNRNPISVEEEIKLTAGKKRHPNYRRENGKRICPVCSKSMSASGNMAAHMRTHTGSKPFKCNKCDYEANNTGALTRHFSRNHKTLSFQCKVCSKRHDSQKHLDEHMVKRHMGEERYKCELCTDSVLMFSNKDTLKNHKFKMHKRKRGHKKASSDKSEKPSQETDKKLRKTRVKAEGPKKESKSLIKKEKQEFTCDECSWKCDSFQALMDHLNEHKQMSTTQEAELTIQNKIEKEPLEGSFEDEQIGNINERNEPNETQIENEPVENNNVENEPTETKIENEPFENVESEVVQIKIESETTEENI